MNLIVAVDENWGIGKENHLLTHIPEDLKFFKAKTMGNVILMGRRTLESFPGGKPLPGRINLVLTKKENFFQEGVHVCHSVEEALKMIGKWEEKEVFVAGGGSIYRQFLEFCDTAYITKIEKIFEADTFFPDLDHNPQWEQIEQGERKEQNGIFFRFYVYRKK